MRSDAALRWLAPLVASALALVGAGARAAEEAAAGSSFRAGHEAAVLGLLAPHDVDTFRCGAWRLEDVRIGPECALRFDLVEDGTGAALTAALRPVAPGAGAPGRSIAVALERDGRPAVGNDALLACVDAAVARNDPGDFFAARCAEARTAPAAEPPATPWGDVLSGIAFLAVAALALLLLRRGKGAVATAPAGGPVPLARLSRRSALALAALTALALALLVRVMAARAPGEYEIASFGLGATSFHPPLQRVLMAVWLWLGDALGVGGELLWLRLANLPVAAALLVLLVRVGRVVGAPAAGWTAAALAATLPTMVDLAARQGPYFAETALAAWFLERLATWLFLRRAVERSLVVAAAAALWTGHMTMLIVAPGVVLFLVTAWRRGERRRALASLLLLAALYAPIAASVLNAVADYAALSVPAATDTLAATATAAVHGHDLLPVEGPSVARFVGFPWEKAEGLMGTVGAGLALGGFLLLLVRRPRAGWFPALVVALHAAAATVVMTRPDNHASLLPLLVFAPAWGLGSLPARTRRTPLAAPACALLAVVALGSATAGALARSDVADVGAAAAWLLAGPDVHTATAPARQAPEPLVLLSPERDDYYLLCPDRSSVAAFRACNRARYEAKLDPETALETFALGGRPVATFPRMQDFEPWRQPGCPPFRRFAERAPWSRGPWFLLLARSVEDTLADCVAAFDAAGCRTGAEAPGIHVLVCPALAAPSAR